MAGKMTGSEGTQSVSEQSLLAEIKHSEDLLRQKIMSMALGMRHKPLHEMSDQESELATIQQALNEKTMMLVRLRLQA
jgi:hypothetical protein